MAQQIPNFKGTQYARGTTDYDEHRYQYGYSSHTDRVNPALVAYPVDENDVSAAVKYANQRGIAVALRTGGHQYSAASSTVGDNIQLDLSQAFLTFEDQGSARVRVGISFGLREFNEAMGKLGYFVPHGQCSHVHVGGHAHTGGYGQLGRSFGLFGDHIQEVEIVNANGEIQKIARGQGSQEDKDLFYAILGGSPGNYATLTHLTIQAHQDADHPYSRGLKFFCLYRKDLVKQFLDIKVEMANDPNFPRDLDYCLTVLGSTPFSIFSNLGIDDEFQKEHPEIFGENDIKFWPNNILIYVQWANTGGAAQDKNSEDYQFAMKWFDRIHDVARKARPVNVYWTYFDGSKHRPMSQLTHDWIFTNVREFELPYEKRTYMTHSPTLVQDKWSTWCSDRIDVAMQDSDLKLSIQIQNFGGQNSLFYRNGLVGDTAYSWRDSTICCVMDCFYKSGARNKALAWQTENDKCVDPQTGVFNKGDRRVLWGSYGSYDLYETRLNYHETEEKYQRLVAIKRRVDTTGVFVANTFCVGWNTYPNRAATQPAAVSALAASTASNKKKKLLGAAAAAEDDTTVSLADGFDEEAMVTRLLTRKRPVHQLADIVERAQAAASSGSIRVSVFKAAASAVVDSVLEKKRKAVSQDNNTSSSSSNVKKSKK